MKKLLSLLLVGVFAMSLLVGCGEKSDEQKAKDAADDAKAKVKDILPK